MRTSFRLTRQEKIDKKLQTDRNRRLQFFSWLTAFNPPGRPLPIPRIPRIPRSAPIRRTPTPIRTRSVGATEKQPLPAIPIPHRPSYPAGQTRSGIACRPVRSNRRTNALQLSCSHHWRTKTARKAATRSSGKNTAHINTAADRGASAKVFRIFGVLAKTHTFPEALGANRQNACAKPPIDPKKIM